jgi:hypothetical protein
LLGIKLNLPDADKVSYVDAVDTELQFGGQAKIQSGQGSQQSARNARILPSRIQDSGVGRIHSSGLTRKRARSCK